MRKPAIFLLALGIGALVVRGQDSGDSNAALQRRIDDLAGLLQQRAAARARPAGARLEQRRYTVADLVASVPDEWISESNLTPSKFAHRDWAWMEQEPRRSAEVDWLIELIRQTVAPDSWDVIEGANIEPKNGALFVTTVPAVHERIGKFLGRVREYLAPRFAVELIAVPVDEGVRARLSGTTRDVDPELAPALAAGPRLATWTLTGVDSQQVVVRAGRERRYMADYDVEIAQGSEIGDPVPHDVFDGAQAEVRCMLDRGRGGALVFVRAELTRLDDPIRRVQTEHGPLELPRLAVTRLRTGCWVPLERPVLLGFAADGPEGAAFLAVVHRVGG